LGSLNSTITGLEFIDNMTVLAMGVFESLGTIWNINTLSVLDTYIAFGYSLDTYTNTSGAKTAAQTGVGGVGIFNPLTGTFLRGISVPGGDVFDASWSPDGTSIATTGSDGAVRIWNAGTGSETFVFTAHTTIVIAVDWSPNGAQIASLDRSGKVYVWDAASGQVLNSFNVFSSTVTWSPDSQRLAYSAGNGSIVIVDPTPDNLLTNGTFTGALAPWTTAAAPNPADLVWRIQEGVLEFYRTTTSTFGAISQTTGTALPALTPLEARLSIGNSSGVRRRLTVTLEDASDGTRLQNCVFWLPANAPLRTFIVRTYTPQAWRCCNGCT
jgi:WD40 repeat protein